MIMILRKSQKWKEEIEQIKMEKKTPSRDTDGRYTVMHTKANQYTHEDHKKIRYAQMNPKEGLQCNGDKYTQTDNRKD